MERVTLLWSGGWDGTFRLLQLCQYEIEIQPVYVIDRIRGSREMERQRMAQIRELASRRFPAKILDIQFYQKEWILENCADSEISQSFAYLRSTYHVGSQYEWFALLSKHLGNVPMESAVVHQYHGKVEEAIKNEGILAELEDPILPTRYCVLPKDGNRKASIVFGNLILPVIRLTKEDEKRIAEENGWMDIMELSWFCHKPINGEPCGLCGPCDDAMNTGMAWRMPPAARRRNKFRKPILFYRRVRRALKRFTRRKEFSHG